ncbi:MAG: hypothetical protein JWP91_781 [Fibrobacteres bacterium]|nr:hypothetical protein [Fibrobacterota bacterium]
MAAEIRGKLESWGFDENDYGGPFTNDGILIDPEKQFEVKESQIAAIPSNPDPDLLPSPESILDGGSPTHYQDRE